MEIYFSRFKSEKDFLSEIRIQHSLELSETEVTCA